MLTAVFYLLLFHVSKDGPLMRGGNMPAGLKANVDSLGVTDSEIAKAADGQNVQLHVSLTDPNASGNINWFVVRYFSSVYRLYPSRVYIGSDDKIINGAGGFFEADRLPAVAWMREHHISHVFTLLPPVPQTNH